MRYHESDLFISQGNANEPVWRKLASPPTDESGAFVVVTLAANLDLNVGARTTLTSPSTNGHRERSPVSKSPFQTIARCAPGRATAGSAVTAGHEARVARARKGESRRQGFTGFRRSAAHAVVWGVCGHAGAQEVYHPEVVDASSFDLGGVAGDRGAAQRGGGLVVETAAPAECGGVPRD